MENVSILKADGNLKNTIKKSLENVKWREKIKKRLKQGKRTTINS
jgi:hypothetical protein